MKTLILIILLFFPLQANAFDKWTKTDTGLQVTYGVLHIIDWGQTLDIARNPDKFYEMNPLLGKHPSIGKVNTYFIGTLIGHTAIAYILPSKYRRIWQIVWIGIEGKTVVNNFSIGVKCGW